MNYQGKKKAKCDFAFFFIFNHVSVIENGGTSLCRGNSELIRVSLTFRYGGLTMNINSVLTNAVRGAEDGLKDARAISNQIAVGSPAPEEDSNKGNSARVEKTSDTRLGRIVDEKA